VSGKRRSEEDPQVDEKPDPDRGHFYRLKRLMVYLGLTDKDYGPRQEGVTLVTDLPRDTRAINARCAICLRSIQPGRLKAIPNSTEQACTTCITAPQRGEYVLRRWLTLPPEVRRARISTHFGFDPMIRADNPTEGRWPQTVQLEMIDRVNEESIPVGYWHLGRERGWL
jgi:hypothetical protein